MTGTIFEDNDDMVPEADGKGLLFNEDSVVEDSDDLVDLGEHDDEYDDDDLDDDDDFDDPLLEEVEAMSKDVSSLVFAVETLTDHILKIGNEIAFLRADIILNEPKTKERPKARPAGRPSKKPPKIQIPKKIKAAAKKPAASAKNKKATKKKVRKSKR